MIVAVGKNNEIGLDNKMLWHIPEDFKSFKKITTGHHMVMGRKTFESIGSPLPGRTSMVLSRSGFEYPGIDSYDNVDDIIEEAKKQNEQELFIIGGAEIYNMFMPLASKLYVSRVNYEGKADTYFPEINEQEWESQKEIYYEKTEAKGKEVPDWKLVVYKRKYF